MSGLLPTLGPIATARAALDLATGVLAGDGTRLRRFDGADAELVALVEALGRLCSILAQCAARELPINDAETPQDLLKIIRVHQEARHDLEGL